MPQFTDKTVFISGAAGALGMAILKEFAKCGANIVAHARAHNPEFEKELTRLTKEFQISIIPIYFDLNSEAQIKSTISELLKSVSPDILVNNAGMMFGGRLFQLTPIKLFREIFEINLFSQMLITQLLLKSMLKRKNGAIINIGSIAGLDPHPGVSAYGVSKSAFMTWTKILAAETGFLGIRVNAVAPNILTTASAYKMGENSKSIMTENCAMKRLGTPEEVACLVRFLASDEGAYINGTIVRIDGGML